jgi:chaperonin GroEL (HSP60 family)
MINIEIVITADKYDQKNNFSQSFLKLINDDANLKSLIEDQPEAIASLIKNGIEDGLEIILPKHLSIDSEFALRLNLFDSMDCSCLTSKSDIGAILQTIMIDNFQLVLTRKHWKDTSKLLLFFDAVEYGLVDEFIERSLK